MVVENYHYRSHPSWRTDSEGYQDSVDVARDGFVKNHCHGIGGYCHPVDNLVARLDSELTPLRCLSTQVAM